MPPWSLSPWEGCSCMLVAVERDGSWVDYVFLKQQALCPPGLSGDQPAACRVWLEAPRVALGIRLVTLGGQVVEQGPAWQLLESN